MAEFDAFTESQRRRMRYAEAMMMQGSSAEPVQHWAQGLARLGQAGIGGWLGYKGEEEAKSERERLNKMYAGIIQSQIDAEKPSGAPPAQPPATPPMEKGQNIADSANRFLDEAFWGPPPGQSQVSFPPGTHFGIRNNNPMNIMGDPSTLGKVYPGVTGKYETRPGMSYLKFDTPEAGLAAAAQTLRYHYGRGADTLAKIFNTIAPNVPGHGNNPTAYAAMASKVLGVGPNDKINVADPAVMSKLLPFIVQTETGTKFDGYTPEMYTAAATRERGAQPPAADAPANQSRAAMLRLIKTMVASGDPQMFALGFQMFAQMQKSNAADTTDIRNYKMAVQQGYKGTFQDWIIASKQAGASKNIMTVDQRGESEFFKNVAKNQAERFDKIVQSGTDAKTMVAQVQALRELATKFESGKGAELKAALGPYAEMLGAKIDGLDGIQAYKAIISRLAPQMRVAGSGATSDFEMRMFLEALPGLGKTPQGNELISRTLDAISEHRIAAAEIASRAMAGEISAREAEKQIRALPDPLTLWKKSGKSLLQGSDRAAPSGRPQPGALPPGYRPIQ